MTLRVLHVTDTHLFAEPHALHHGLDTEGALEQVLAAARTESWDLALVTGDLAHDGSPAAYNRLAGHLDGLGVPALCIPGNHDDPAALRAVLPCGRVAWQRAHAAAPWTVLMLDSHLPGEVGGELGAEELGALAAELAAATGPVLVALHHPPVEIGSAWMNRDRLRDHAAFWAVVDGEPRVRGVLWGHIHQDFEQRRGGTLLMASPSTGLQFKPHASELVLDDRPPGYRRLLLGDDGRIDTAVVRVRLESRPL